MFKLAHVLTPTPRRLHEDLPYPPRFWWLKRLGLAYAVFLLAMSVTYAGWVKLSHHRLDAVVAEIHARGEPVLPQDFDPPAIPDDRNAAVLLRRAAASLGGTDKWKAYLTGDARDDPRWLTSKELEQIDALVRQNPATIRLVRAARELPSADWGIRLRKKLIRTLLPDLNEQRDLAQFVACAALAAHARGDDAEAVELCRDLLQLAEHVNDTPPFYVVQMVGLKATGMEADVIEQLAPRLDLHDPASRQSAQALIRELLDERRLEANWLRTAQAQRTFTADVFVSYLEGKGALTEPMYRLDAARAMRSLDGDVAAARCEGYSEAASLVPEYHPPWQAVDFRDVPQWRRSFSWAYPPRLVRHTRLITDLDRVPFNRGNLIAYYHARANRHAAAVLIAARIFQLDHARRLPSSWDDLVPAYLPAAPADPFAPTGAPLRLLRRGDELVIYSIGEDLKDDGGAEVDKRGRLSVGNRYATIDYVYRFPAPATHEALRLNREDYQRKEQRRRGQ